MIRPSNSIALNVRDRFHPVEHNLLPCVSRMLDLIDAQWHSVLDFLWENNINTLACCGGHEGMKSEVFIGWESSGPGIDEVLSMAYGLVVGCDLKLKWEIFGAQERFGTGFCWILQVRCPDVEKGWSKSKLAGVREDIQKFARQLPIELLRVRDCETFAREYL